MFNEARFWRRTRLGDVPAHRPELGHCIEWTGGKREGYGRLRIDGKLRGAHVVAFELQNGKLAPGFYVLHKCDNRACIKHEHLWAGSYKDNAIDAVAKGRHKNPVMPGDAHPMRKLSQDQVDEMRALAKAGKTLSELAMMFPMVHRKTVWRILAGKRWQKKGDEAARVLLRSHQVEGDKLKEAP